MENSLENRILTIKLIERLDSNNADEINSEIESIKQGKQFDQIILDCDDLKYTSSAGLRVILKTKKAFGNLKLINVSSEVYEVFDMTGFTEMMSIEKAFRKMNIDNCEIIGEGSNGIVYRINEDTIIKVYKNPDALDDIKKERELARTALVLGVNTAIPYDVVKVGDRYGSVFELLSAKSLTKLIKADKENIDKYVKVFSDMLKEIHQTIVKEGTLPSVKNTALTWVKWLEKYIDKQYFDKLIQMVEAIPEDNHMIHGDYHTNNVHYANNEAILIDMDTLSVGNKVFEFASIYLAFIGYGEVDHSKVESFMKLDWETANYVFYKLIDFYFDDLDAKAKENAINKAKVIGYVRMLRRTIKREPDNTALIEHSKKQLYHYVDIVDDLAL